MWKIGKTKEANATCCVTRVARQTAENVNELTLLSTTITSFQHASRFHFSPSLALAQGNHSSVPTKAAAQLLAAHFQHFRSKGVASLPLLSPHFRRRPGRSQRSQRRLWLALSDVCAAWPSRVPLSFSGRRHQALLHGTSGTALPLLASLISLHPLHHLASRLVLFSLQAWTSISMLSLILRWRSIVADALDALATDTTLGQCDVTQRKAWLGSRLELCDRQVSTVRSEGLVVVLQAEMRAWLQLQGITQRLDGKSSRAPSDALIRLLQDAFYSIQTDSQFSARRSWAPSLSTDDLVSHPFPLPLAPTAARLVSAQVRCAHRD